MSGEWVHAISIADLPEGSRKLIRHYDKRISIFRLKSIHVRRVSAPLCPPVSHISIKLRDQLWRPSRQDGKSQPSATHRPLQ